VRSPRWRRSRTEARDETARRGAGRARPGPRAARRGPHGPGVERGAGLLGGRRREGEGHEDGESLPRRGRQVHRHGRDGAGGRVMGRPGDGRQVRGPHRRRRPDRRPRDAAVEPARVLARRGGPPLPAPGAGRRLRGQLPRAGQVHARGRKGLELSRDAELADGPAPHGQPVQAPALTTPPSLGGSVNRLVSGRAGLLAALMLSLPSLALAQPNITGIFPSKGSANTGVTVDILGTGFGALGDRIYFPGSNPGAGTGFVNPVAVIAGGVRVRVPATWSGNVQVQANGVGPLSNNVNHDISFNWSGQKWPNASLPFTWFLNNSGAPGCTFNDTRDALITGYNAWSCASGVSASFGGGTAVATTALDGTNCRYWQNSGWSPGTIAVATWWFNGANEILHADIAFNSQHFTWSCAGAGGSMDVGNIGTHEEGHTIGLLDMYGTADAPKTMYGFGSNGETQKQTLPPA